MGSERHVELQLPTTPLAPQQARHAVAAIVEGLAGDVAFRAQLLVSELVTNSVQHGPVQLGVVVVRARRDGKTVRVEVRDAGAPFDSNLPAVSDEATSGRGLQLVGALVDRWGTDHQNGNVVWFEIDIPRGVDPSARSPLAHRIQASHH